MDDPPNILFFLFHTGSDTKDHLDLNDVQTAT